MDKSSVQCEDVLKTEDEIQLSDIEEKFVNLIATIIVEKIFESYEEESNNLYPEI